MIRLRTFWDSMRGTYWAVPSAMAVVASGLSFGMIQLDERTTARFLDQLSWVYTGGPEGARAVLSTIAASMITVAGVSFSITIVALTLASQQFGPRLLRNFLRDLGNQVTLGTFTSTFIYCLLVLRTVRGNDDSQFVPHLAVTVGVLLAMFSLGVLIFFIHHIATSIQASQIIANVAGDLERSIERLFPEEIGRGPIRDGSAAALGPEPGETDLHRVASTRSGYVQAIDSSALVVHARTQDVLIRIEARPGVFVRHGSALLSLSSAVSRLDSLDRPLHEAFIIGADRTGTQDVGFFISQLVELAVRALSPGINDPETACACVDRLAAGLCQLAGRRMPSPYRYDEHGVLRVIAIPVTFPSMLDAAFDEIERYGRSSVSVSCRLLRALRDLAPCVSAEDDRLALRRHADAIDTRDAFRDRVDRDTVSAQYRDTVDALRPPA